MIKVSAIALFVVALLTSCSTPYSNPRYIRPESQPGYDGIKAVISNSRDQIRMCYEKLIASEPKAQGRMVADFAISTSGRVTTLQFIENEIRSPALEQCLSQVLFSLQFAPNATVQTVKYPFTFLKNE